MAGCYGSSAEDRHFERMLDNYLSQYDDDEYCECDIIVNYHIKKVVIQDGLKMHEFDPGDILRDDNTAPCPVCGEEIHEEETENILELYNKIKTQ